MKYKEYKNLVYNLVITDLKLKYKSSFLGFFWSLLEPLILICILLFVFTKLFVPNMENYGVFLITGFTVWNFFIKGTNNIDTLVSKASLISNINFPRELIIFSVACVTLINFLLEFFVFLIVIFLLGVKINLNFLYLPLLIFIQFLFVLGVSLILNSLYVKFRDLNHIWSVFANAMFFATPIVYPNSLLLQKFPFLLVINPMTFFITKYRNIILYDSPLSLKSIVILIFISFFYLSIGLVIFNKKKKSFAEDI